MSATPATRTGKPISYLATKYDVALKYRHVDGFPWSAGVFEGPIEDYDLVDLTANYRISERLQIGLNISNLLDEDHYQIFGGDLIERRALGHLSIRW